MDKREELSSIIKSDLQVPFGRIYLYPNISDKVMAKVAKHFDQNINTNNVVAFSDPTLTCNGKNGIVFMVAGAYYRYFASKPFYFNYEDIVRIVVIPDINQRTSSDAIIGMTFSNDTTLTIGSGDFQKENLKEVLLKLKAKVQSYSDVVTFKSTGEVGKVSLTDGQQKACHAIIHTASVAAGGVGTGLAQLPLVDTAIITPIQVTMITSLGTVFNIRVTEGMAKGIIAGAAASFVGRSASQLLVGWIPGLGNAINTATAAGLTEAIGWMAVAHFFDLQQKEKVKYKVEGMKQGYNQASEEYEVKLRKQADLFIQQQRVYEAEIATYRELLSQYEEYIQELEDELAHQEAGSQASENIKSRLTTSRAIHSQLTSLKVG